MKGMVLWGKALNSKLEIVGLGFLDHTISLLRLPVLECAKASTQGIFVGREGPRDSRAIICQQMATCNFDHDAVTPS